MLKRRVREISIEASVVITMFERISIYFGSLFKKYSQSPKLYNLVWTISELFWTFYKKNNYNIFIIKYQYISNKTNFKIHRKLFSFKNIKLYQIKIQIEVLKDL